MLKKYKYLYRSLIAAEIVAFLLLFSVSFSRQRVFAHIWFLGEKGNYTSILLRYGDVVEPVIYLSAFLLGVVLIRQFLAYTHLPKGWRMGLSYAFLAVLGMASMYGVLVSGIMVMDDPEQLYSLYRLHFVPGRIAAIATLLIFLWDLLAPRVRKALHGRTKANARA